MIDITNVKATAFDVPVCGHLLLCWIDNARYCAIRVRGGLLCFHAPVSGHTEAAVRYAERDSMVCLDVGDAVVRWCDTDAVQQGSAREPPGTIVVDQIGIAITGKEAEADSNAYSQGKDQGAWRLADGEPPEGDSTRLVIRKWEIGVRGNDGEFVKFEAFPR